jgi:hypothetical protein
LAIPPLSADSLLRRRTQEDDEATGTRVPAAAAAADDDGAGPSDASQWEPPSPPRAPAAVEALVAFSPRLITMVDVPRGEVVEDAEEDKRTLRSMRTRVATRDGREFGRAAAKASASTPAVSGDLAYRKMVTNTEEKRPDFGLTKHITVGGDDDDASRASAQKMMGAADVRGPLNPSTRPKPFFSAALRRGVSLARACIRADIDEPPLARARGRHRAVMCCWVLLGAAAR